MTMALPISLAKARRVPRSLAIGLAIVASVVSLLTWKLTRPAQTTSINSFYTVIPMDLDIVIRKDGELQAVKNLDVVCPVEGLNTIHHRPRRVGRQKG